ncbi:MlaD family protein [Marinoscillum furvescens]|uniref:Phospholipid/cholesterol/gamma-HCH transport system substrate-binding protein n=1 Tax=Marinoscillum furvescens DSM 4134 TaxID=1122208 RepID=A0A3D9KWX1_MARFU|nr:MlaD family protein [Marinoscillum furvescens]RED92647.1 phospholipid/cholesterol/gamma-HCH transport system substrate-binding protein [Marinoscillum furvescens DSM 4134]
MSKEFKVGLIALVSGVLLYYGFNYLKGVDFFSPTNKYYVIYDNVDGLNKSNPVIINGLAVGRVSRIKLMQNDENLIMVELDIDETITLGDSTVASLTNTDFLGSKGIVLTIGPLHNPIEPGDTLISYVDKGLNEILASAEPVASNLNTTITRVNEILIGLKGSGEKINETIDEVRKTTISVNEIISENQAELAEIMSSTAVLIDNLNAKLDQVDPIMAKTEGVLDSLNALEVNKTLASVRGTLDSLNATITMLKNPDGTLGKLVADDSLYQLIEKTIVDFDSLANHLNYYPKHFFAPLGKSHKRVMKDLKKED